MNKKILFALGAAFLATSGLARAEEFVVGQKNKAFTVKKLSVKAGDAVAFRNDDPFFHNIFSLTDVQPFDLGSYPQGQARKIVFNKAGKLDIECAIHPEMKMVVEVAK